LYGPLHGRNKGPGNFVKIKALHSLPNVLPVADIASLIGGVVAKVAVILLLQILEGQICTLLPSEVVFDELVGGWAVLVFEFLACVGSRRLAGVGATNGFIFTLARILSSFVFRALFAVAAWQEFLRI
jgi:hypothetical protein